MIIIEKIFKDDWNLLFAKTERYIVLGRNNQVYIQIIIAALTVLFINIKASTYRFISKNNFQFF
ncbi:Uncharacterized protein CTYZ_00004006 [Cryptosporidium tyzzeri]|nr:Uncharacterized protein CTYZ_00004006 [Cryptosporidium tyzzeri]